MGAAKGHALTLDQRLERNANLLEAASKSLADALRSGARTPPIRQRISELEAEREALSAERRAGLEAAAQASEARLNVRAGVIVGEADARLRAALAALEPPACPVFSR